jgi:hypothetical protein
VGVGQTYVDIINRQFRIHGKEVCQVRVIRQVRHDPLKRDPGAFDKRFGDHHMGFMNQSQNSDLSYGPDVVSALNNEFWDGFMNNF